MRLIEIENLGKRYVKGHAFGMESAREAASRWLASFFSSRTHRSADDEFWALRGVSFHVDRGDVVGILGNNGAGKTTLFRLLSQITLPSEGHIDIRGRVGTLLGAAAGFHPELTGRDNIYFSASIMGMRPEEIRSKFDAIVEFSGVSDFLDTSVKHYSTGMVTRLGFSIAAHLLPDILILDEILAVSDVEFQKKAMKKVAEIGQSGHTILFVSHDMNAVEALCKSVLVLDHGRTRYFGPAREGIAMARQAVDD